MSTFIQYQNIVPDMPVKKAILLLVLLQQFTCPLLAQVKDNEPPAVINVQVKNNQANFNSSLRPLRQISGAPETFYSYFWEFGDGQYSFEEKPKHFYSDSGSFETRLYATNNYDDGKPPPSRPHKVRINSTGNTNSYASNNTGFFKHGGAIEMKVNCMPKADEDMILIMGYRNEEKNTALDGSLVLFYNEKQFKTNNFDLTEERVYNNEKKSSLSSLLAYQSTEDISASANQEFTGGPNAQMPLVSMGFYGKFSALISSKQKIFRHNNTWRFSDLKKGEEKYFFLTLHTTPEMIKDTNSLLTLTGMFIPDDPNGQLEEYTLELQIVASHDPNRMMLKNRRLNYRFTGKKKEMEYTVRFQNTGRGPATNTMVAIGVPAMLDAGSIKILDYYPKCVYCKNSIGSRQSCLDTIIHKDSIFFKFKNIYIPGLRQQGFNDPDSTTGFVKYRIHFNKKLKKLSFESNAAITFDNNKAIYTNSPRGYFKPGQSAGVIAGYNKFLGANAGNENYFSIGASLSPYAPYKKYLQPEIFAGYLKLPEKFISARTDNLDTLINAMPYHIFGREIYSRSTIIKIDLVPLQIRYNFIKWLGAGIGAQVVMDAYTKTTYREVLHLIQQPNPQPLIREKTFGTAKWFSNLDVGLFGDIQVGRVRLGPVAGVRFLHYFSIPRNCLFIYAAWRI
jgi:hypothetical protein